MFDVRSLQSRPLQSLESAHEYVALLLEALTEAAQTIANELKTPSEMTRDRQVDALHLTNSKLKALEQHLVVSGRLLTDLQTLRERDS